ncbi:hypothetical protein [Alicyclobacillus dauci]|uniref:FlgN protein n=1 Tax=Alicyclobacillus dauci TaxID=1475485 RepID=A0ABY6Z581_9BACL|nr:hypothetical protein [Alicyclobacillus dauci]WAH37439.1 hypothetical protein NZD86_02550 [Alicyclobacillus dauci]
MIEDLCTRLNRANSLIEKFLESPPINHNPLEIRLRAVLEEEQRVLCQAMQAAGESPIDLHPFRNFISVVYRDDEAAQSTVRAWIRASRWMHSNTEQQLDDVERALQDISRELEQVSPMIELMYGDMDTKYIVPIAYRRRPQIRRAKNGVGE